MPDVSEDYYDYAGLNDRYLFPSRDPRAYQEIARLYYTNPTAKAEDLVELGNRSIARNLRLFQIVLRSKIQQMSDNPLWEAKHGSEDKDFQAAQRTLPKTLEEILVHPTERMIFTRAELADPELMDAALQNMVIDPRMISDTLLENLGLTDLIPAKGEKEEYKLQKRTAAIPEIKKMLHGLEPISRSNEPHAHDLRYFRLMRIGSGKNTGQVLGTQHIEGKKILFKTDLHGAGRRLVHIEQGYEEEVKKLKWIEMTLDSVTRNLKYWQQIKNSDKLAKLKEALGECVNSLEFSRDKTKQKLRDEIKACLDFSDATGRKNPTVVSGKLERAKARIGNRLGKIEAIWSYIGKDKAKVEELISDEERPLLSFVNEVEKLHERFVILKDRPMEDEEKARVISNLMDRRAEAEKLRFEPMLSFAVKFISQIDAVVAALGNDNFDVAAREFVKVYLVAKLARSQKDLTEFYKKISLDAGNLDPNTLVADLQVVNDNLASHPVKPDLEIAEYKPHYGEVYHVLNSIRKKLRELLTQEVATPRSQVASEPAEAKPESKPKRRTLDQVLNTIFDQSSNLMGFAKRIKGKVTEFITGKKAAASPQTVAPLVQPPAQKPAEFPQRVPRKYTQDEKLETFEAIKKRIRDFDFVDLAQSLP